MGDLVVATVEHASWHVDRELQRAWHKENACKIEEVGDRQFRGVLSFMGSKSRR